MSGYCENEPCEFESNNFCTAGFDYCPQRKAHKPEPNESVSSSRTRGSLTASHNEQSAGEREGG